MDIVPFTPQRAVRLAANTAFRAAAISPYARAGLTAMRYGSPTIRAARFMYKNRRPFVSMARRRKATNISNKSGIGVQANTGTNQKEMMMNGNVAQFDGRTLYANELTLIAKAGATNDINTRQRQIIHVSGFSIKGFMSNNSARHVFLNVAVLSPRNNNATTVAADGFFRDYNASRDINFSTGLSGLRMHVLPISTDKFRILAHKRLRVGPAAPDGSTAPIVYNVSPGNSCYWDMYVPLKRNLTYNDDTDTNCESKVFFVLWFSDGTASNTDPTVLNQMTGSIHAVTYYSEVSAPTRTPRFNTDGVTMIKASL